MVEIALEFHLDGTCIARKSRYSISYELEYSLQEHSII